MHVACIQHVYSINSMSCKIKTCIENLQRKNETNNLGQRDSKQRLQFMQKTKSEDLFKANTLSNDRI